ncbi:hypothetical protein CYMTET_33219 [Cymbomonas tetramitiformis]|uniref:Uncharacterized protein n=1 Tax=Cymbomonas tetramitiformis TaxID=36881 RepID=A0AAE0FDC5_9CHLO|nr:hypothetical protein CYMTET_33219 [Cymbomonas tetramitiformis]
MGGTLGTLGFRSGSQTGASENEQGAQYPSVPKDQGSTKPTPEEVEAYNMMMTAMVTSTTAGNEDIPKKNPDQGKIFALRKALDRERRANKASNKWYLNHKVNPEIALWSSAALKIAAVVGFAYVVKQRKKAMTQQGLVSQLTPRAGKEFGTELQEPMMPSPRLTITVTVLKIAGDVKDATIFCQMMVMKAGKWQEAGPRTELTRFERSEAKLSTDVVVPYTAGTAQSVRWSFFSVLQKRYVAECGSSELVLGELVTSAGMCKHVPIVEDDGTEVGTLELKAAPLKRFRQVAHLWIKVGNVSNMWGGKTNSLALSLSRPRPRSVDTASSTLHSWLPVVGTEQAARSQTPQVGILCRIRSLTKQFFLAPPPRCLEPVDFGEQGGDTGK